MTGEILALETVVRYRYPLRAWKVIAKCGCELGKIQEFASDAPLIVCCHGVPLLPLGEVRGDWLRQHAAHFEAEFKDSSCARLYLEALRVARAATDIKAGT